MAISAIGRTAAALAAAAALYLPTCARALQVTSLSPQGEIAKVRQIAVKFDDGAVNFGDPKEPDWGSGP